MMLKWLYPSGAAEHCGDVDFKALYREGIRGVIFDIDNTLVPHGAPADAAARILFRKLRKLGLRTCLVSNNREKRVQPFAEAVKSPYVCKAHKPLPSAMRRAMRLMGTDQASTILIGDQLFTDMWCANLAGIRSLLVSPIDPHEEIQIVLKRIPERVILRHWKKQLKKKV